MVFDQLPDVLLAPTTDRAADRRALSGLAPARRHRDRHRDRRRVARSRRYGRGRGRARRRTRAALRRRLDERRRPARRGPRARQAAHVPVDTVALGTPGRPDRRAQGTARTLHRAGAARPAAARADRARLGRRALTAPRTRAGSTPSTATLGAKIGHHTVTRRRSRPASPAPRSRCSALGSALSLRWFGRLI